jgi:hypothetical protein
MKSFQQTLKYLGVEGWAFGLSGIFAIIFSVASFLGYIPLSTEQSIQILVGAMGALMLAVVSQTAHRHSEFSELRDLLGVANLELIGNNAEYVQHLLQNIVGATTFVSDTILSPPITPMSQPDYFSGSRADYKLLLYKRVIKGEISYRRVEIISSKFSLERTIYRLLLFQGHKFLLRHYTAPPSFIPILNLVSFDDSIVYLRDFYRNESTVHEKTLALSGSKCAEFFREYWNVLWNEAIPLNQGGVIDWGELRRIGMRIGLSSDEFDLLVSRLKETVQRDKRRLRLN